MKIRIPVGRIIGTAIAAEGVITGAYASEAIKKSSEGTSVAKDLAQAGAIAMINTPTLGVAAQLWKANKCLKIKLPFGKKKDEEDPSTKFASKMNKTIYKLDRGDISTFEAMQKVAKYVDKYSDVNVYDRAQVMAYLHSEKTLISAIKAHDPDLWNKLVNGIDYEAEKDGEADENFDTLHQIFLGLHNLSRVYYYLCRESGHNDPTVKKIVNFITTNLQRRFSSQEELFKIASDIVDATNEFLADAEEVEKQESSKPMYPADGSDIRDKFPPEGWAEFDAAMPKGTQTMLDESLNDADNMDLLRYRFHQFAMDKIGHRAIFNDIIWMAEHRPDVLTQFINEYPDEASGLKEIYQANIKANPDLVHDVVDTIFDAAGEHMKKGLVAWYTRMYLLLDDISSGVFEHEEDASDAAHALDMAAKEYGVKYNDSVPVMKAIRKKIIEVYHSC